MLDGPVLETERLRLRLPEERDLELVFFGNGVRHSGPQMVRPKDSTPRTGMQAQADAPFPAPVPKAAFLVAPPAGRR